MILERHFFFFFRATSSLAQLLYTRYCHPDSGLYVSPASLRISSGSFVRAVELATFVQTIVRDKHLLTTNTLRFPNQSIEILSDVAYLVDLTVKFDVLPNAKFLLLQRRSVDRVTVFLVTNDFSTATAGVFDFAGTFALHF